MVRAAANHWLGMKCDAHSGQIQHGKIICAVAHRNHLIERNIFFVCQRLQQFGLFLSVHNLARDSAGHKSIFDFQLVREYVVQAKKFLQMLAKKSEAAGEHRGLVSKRLQRRNQPFGAFGQRNGMQQLSYTNLRQSVQESNTSRKALLEIELAAHCSSCNRRYLLTDSMQSRKLIDDLALYQRGIHVKREQAAVASIYAFALKR